jgi:hypothetical protein
MVPTPYRLIVSRMNVLVTDVSHHTCVLAYMRQLTNDGTTDYTSNCYKPLEEFRSTVSLNDATDTLHAAIFRTLL